MLLVWDENPWQDYLWCHSQNRRILKRSNMLLADIRRNGNGGMGKPEALKHDFAGYSSSSITDEHRLVYKLAGQEVRIAACRYHYGYRDRPARVGISPVGHELDGLAGEPLRDAGQVVSPSGDRSVPQTRGVGFSSEPRAAPCLYGHGVSLNPLELLLLLLASTLPLLVGYFVIRLAVRHGVMDAHRRLPRDLGPPV